MALFTVKLTQSAKQAIRDGVARGANVQRALVKGMRLGAIDVVSAIQIHKLSGKPLRTRTGALKGSLQSRVEVGRSGVSAFIGVPSDSPASRYARILEEGGVIPAVEGKLMVFRDPRNKGKFVFTMKRKAVTIPAFKWLSSGIAENLALFVDALNDEMAKVA